MARSRACRLQRGNRYDMQQTQKKQLSLRSFQFAALTVHEAVLATVNGNAVGFSVR